MIDNNILILIFIFKYSNPFNAVVISNKPFIKFFITKFLMGNKLIIRLKNINVPNIISSVSIEFLSI